MEISDRIRKFAAEGGWVGVDLDGTLFTYENWVGWNVFGEPIQPMIDRVKAWLAADVEVRIVTARVGLPLYTEAHMHDGVHCTLRSSPFKKNICRVTGEHFSSRMMIDAIHAHLGKHGLPALEVQCYKDVNMIELWDDRAIQVIGNTGQTLDDAHLAEITALKGKQFQSLGETNPGF